MVTDGLVQVIDQSSWGGIPPPSCPIEMLYSLGARLFGGRYYKAGLVARPRSVLPHFGAEPLTLLGRVGSLCNPEENPPSARDRLNTRQCLQGPRNLLDCVQNRGS
ncbi:hypothetical protein Bbelb_073140 [Branchiostoma belcheri]|nr:hypothetical protein Bbelb_073140 [Branchiostoma belcheri]